MSTLDTSAYSTIGKKLRMQLGFDRLSTESKGGGSQEPKTPQAGDGDTRTVSTEFSMGFALLDKELSNYSLSIFGTKLDAIRHLDNCLRPSGV